MDASDSRLLKFYETSAAERARLVRREGQLEFIRTKELLDRFLPAPRARIIDVGGGTGAYSSWLASLGHSVHLVDIVSLAGGGISSMWQPALLFFPGFRSWPGLKRTLPRCKLDLWLPLDGFAISAPTPLMAVGVTRRGREGTHLN